LDELSETYSHGMRQRLAFAAALLHRPAALVLDEPMVSLDPRSMRMVKDLLRQQAAEGAIVLMSTHTLAMAEEMADRIAIMNRGRLRFLGSVSELQQMLSAERSSLEDLFLRLTNGEAHGEPAARQQAP
jgi:ABC-2 type transport system ATP-binding protein